MGGREPDSLQSLQPSQISSLYTADCLGALVDLLYEISDYVRCFVAIRDLIGLYESKERLLNAWRGGWYSRHA